MNEPMTKPESRGVSVVGGGVLSAKDARDRQRLARRVFLSALGLGLSLPLSASSARLAIAQSVPRSRRLFLYYLPHGYGRVASKTKTTVQNFDALRASMLQETKLFFDEAVITRKGSVKELLTASYTFVDGSLAGAVRLRRGCGQRVHARRTPGGTRAGPARTRFDLGGWQLAAAAHVLPLAWARGQRIRAADEPQRRADMPKLLTANCQLPTPN